MTCQNIKISNWRIIWHNSILVLCSLLGRRHLLAGCSRLLLAAAGLTRAPIAAALRGLGNDIPRAPALRVLLVLLADVVVLKLRGPVQPHLANGTVLGATRLCVHRLANEGLAEFRVPGRFMPLRGVPAGLHLQLP